MAVPIGLAIDDISMRGVNLLPKDAVVEEVQALDADRDRRSRSRRPSRSSRSASSTSARTARSSDQQAELDAVKAEIAALPQPTGPDDRRRRRRRRGRPRHRRRQRARWPARLGCRLPRPVAGAARERLAHEALGRRSPRRERTCADATTAAAAVVPGQRQPAPTAVSIDGYTYTQPDVARLLARLATLPSLKRVTLTSSSQREDRRPKDVVHFAIVADLNQTGGAS